MNLKNRVIRLEEKKAKGQGTEITVFMNWGDKVTNTKTGEEYTPEQWAEYEKAHPDMITVSQETIEKRQ